MRRLLALGLLFAAVMQGASAAAQTPADPSAHHIAVSLVPETRTPAPGSEITLAIEMRPAAGWHGYWRNPGDAGFPPKIDWTLPTGASVGEPDYPVPQALAIAGLMNHVYERPYALLVPFRIPADAVVGSRAPISARLEYLACTDATCVPESSEVAIALTVGAGAADPSAAARFDAWRRALPRPLGAPASFEAKGGKIRLAVPLPGAVALEAPHFFPATDGVISYRAAQSFSRRGDTLVIETEAADGAPPASISGVLALGGGSGLSITAVKGAVPAAEAPLTGATGAGGSTLAVTLLALAGAIAGGLVLNVMPCVFPILSLKALSLARAGGGEREVRREALAYTAGVILVCVALGGLILAMRAAGAQAGWAFQLQNPAVIFALVLLTSAIGFNLAGLFELGAVSAGSDLAAKGGLTGAFWTGVLAAFVATPCTGPFMAAALGAALVLPVAAALTVFAGLGLGLALPFLAIAYAPGLRRRLPKPGPWMARFRQALAMPMFLTALGLAWVLGRQTAADGVVVAAAATMLVAFGLWGTGLRQRAGRAHAWRPAALGGVLAIAAVALLPGASSHPSAAPTQAAALRFDEAKLASLRAAGKPVFLYFTADWCLTCKVNEKAAIDREQTVQAFSEAGVVTMVGDWTDGDPAIGRFIRAQGRSGVPLYLWYAPDAAAPTMLPQILTPSMLAQAAGRT